MKTILPGATIGVLGSGQLGRMFAIASRRMGYRVHTFSPDEDTPTGQVADMEVQADYNDLERVEEFARGVDVVTFEFENVPLATVEACEKYAPVHPRGEVLFITQNRLREKTWLSKNGFQVAPFRHILGTAHAGIDAEKMRLQVLADARELGLPCVLKTAGFGYDGKGQTKIHRLEDCSAAADELNGEDGVLESWVSFEREVSVVAARGQNGEFAHFGVVENRHVNHILDVTIAPANVPSQVLAQAIEISREVLEKLDVVGVLCVEFFLTHDNQLIINELAPRPHNSGHWSFDGCVTSQFEQQLRAVCGLPLGSTEILRPCAMANLLGDAWENGEPNWASALKIPEVKLHLYGKAEARAGRKMGHLTALAATTEDAVQRVQNAREALQLR